MATIRQKLAIKKIVENGGNARQAMKKAGYSPAMYNNPKRLTESKAFKENLGLLDDTRYLKELDKLAMAQDDKRAKLQAIDAIFKLKGRYPKEAIDLDISLQRQQLIEPD